MRPRSGMHGAECARACACLRGHIPGGAPVLRCGTRPESPGPSKESKYHWVVPGAAPALLRSLLGLQPHLRSASAQAEQVPPALAGGCDPESLALHAGHVRSMGRLRGHIPRGAPVPRSGVPSSHPHLAQRASSDLCRASLGERPASLEAGMALIGTALAMLAWSPPSHAPTAGTRRR